MGTDFATCSVILKLQLRWVDSVCPFGLAQVRKTTPVLDSAAEPQVPDPSRLADLESFLEELA